MTLGIYFITRQLPTINKIHAKNPFFPFSTPLKFLYIDLLCSLFSCWDFNLRDWLLHPISAEMFAKIVYLDQQILFFSQDEKNNCLHIQLPTINNNPGKKIPFFPLKFLYIVLLCPCFSCWDSAWMLWLYWAPRLALQGHKTGELWGGIPWMQATLHLAGNVQNRGAAGCCQISKG